MPKDLQKHTLNLRTGDFAYLDNHFYSTPNNASEVIRAIVSKYVDHIRSTQQTPDVKVKL